MMRIEWTEEQKQALAELDEIYENVAYPIISKWQDYPKLKRIFTSKQLRKIENYYSHRNHYQQFVEDSYSQLFDLIKDDQEGIDLAQKYHLKLRKMLDCLQDYAKNVVTLPQFVDVFNDFDQAEEAYSSYIAALYDEIIKYMVEVENERAV